MDGGYFNIKNIDWLETKEMQFSAQAACTGKEGLIGSRCPQSPVALAAVQAQCTWPAC